MYFPQKTFLHHEKIHPGKDRIVEVADKILKNPIFRPEECVKRIENEEEENRRPVDRYNNRRTGGGVVVAVRHRHHNHHEKPEKEIRKPAANETHV